MSTERFVPTFISMGTDIDEARLNLDTFLLGVLGSDEAVRRWKETGNDHLEGKLPEVVIHVDPDKVVRAAFALKNRT